MVDFTDITQGDLVANRYRIERLLRAGGMGAVYVATHTQTGRVIALKLMRNETVCDEEARTKFLQEATVPSRIDSVHVVDVMDAGFDESRAIPFIAMELLSGQDLAEYLQKQKRLSPEEVYYFLSQAAKALDKAHSLGIIHRDLKPENMFVVIRDDMPPMLKLLDFGLAKLIHQATRHSAVGAGTPFFMAPEQTKKGASLGASTDVWALGLIAYLLLVGRVYWLADDIHQLFAEVLVQPLDSAITRASLAGLILPDGFDSWFFKCVSRDPKERFSSAGEAIRMFGRLFDIPETDSGFSTRKGSLTPTGLMDTVQALPANLAMTQLATGSPETISQVQKANSPGRKRRFFAEIAIVIGAALTMGTVILVTREPVTPKIEPFTNIPQNKISLANSSSSRATTILHSLGTVPSLSPSLSVEPLPDETHKLCPDKTSRIPGGSFTMEFSKKVVSVRSFCMDRMEVSVSDYDKCVKKGHCSPAFQTVYVSSVGGETKESSYCHGNQMKFSDHPVNCVDWYQANQYCLSLQKRLPTEDEYEWAARNGNQGTSFPWGNEPLTNQACWNGHGNKLGDGHRKSTCSVGSNKFDTNQWGIMDLAGNVAEWTSSTSGTNTEERIYRGGGWRFKDAENFRAGHRSKDDPRARYKMVGFRCAVNG